MTLHHLPTNVRAVVFDVDNTLLKGTTVYHAVSSLNMLPSTEKKKLIRLASHNLIYTLFSFENGLDFLKKEGLSLVKGHESELFKTYLQNQLRQKIDKKLYSSMMRNIEHYKNENKIIILASADPDFLVEIVSEKVEADYYIATKLEEIDNIFTGSTVGEINHGIIKAKNVARLLQELKIEQIDVAAFTDSNKDFYLLESAGEKIAVNPDLLLRYKSLKNNWVILDVSPKYLVTKTVGLSASIALTYFCAKKVNYVRKTRNTKFKAVVNGT